MTPPLEEFVEFRQLGVDWKKFEEKVRKEADRGFAGRFGPGLPRVSDGSLLFVQHMVSKFRKGDGASRIAVVLNGSPLFTGGAGSGESEIRRWIIENDWLEAIIGKRPVEPACSVLLAREMLGH